MIARLSPAMISDLSVQRKGELYVLASCIIWAIFPAMTVFLIATVPPIALAGLTMLSSCVLFAIILTVRNGWSSVWKGTALKYILAGTVINGIGYHGLVFFAMSHTTAGNATIILQMEVFFAFIILSLLMKHEKFQLNHFLGAVLMVLGAFIILGKQTSGTLQSGDLIIVLATALAPFGNYFQQRARKEVSAQHILMIRSLLAGSFLLVLSRLLGESFSVEDAWGVAPMIFLNGFLVMGIAKIFWIEGFIRIPITKANSIAAIVPFFGLIFAYLILGEVPTQWQLLSIVPIVAGVLLLMRKDRKTE